MSLVSELVKWVQDESLLESTQLWAQEHSHLIDASSGEFLLRYTDLHREFEAWVDSKLEKWLIDHESTSEELQHALKLTADTIPDGLAFFEYLTPILAVFDFEVFMEMMRGVAQSSD